MKRTLSLIGTLALATGLVQATSVESVNTVGYINLPVKGAEYNMLAVNWDAIGGGAIHIQDLFADVEGLTGGDGLGSSDNLRVWDPVAEGYNTYYLYDSEGAYPAYDGKWLELDESISDVTFTKGASFWLLTRGADTDLTMAGQVPTAETVDFTIYAGNFTMIANAYSAAMALNSDFDWLLAGATGSDGLGSSDIIRIWDPIAGGYNTYYLYDSEGEYPAYDGKWLELDESITDAELPLGKGAWYLSRGQSDWTWTQERPY